MISFDSFDKYTLGDFVVWLFDYAEVQNDDCYTFCHEVYDDLVYEFLNYKEGKEVEFAADPPIDPPIWHGFLSCGDNCEHCPD